MSAVPKDQDFMSEFVEAIFQQIEGQVHHPAPSVARELVAAVVMARSTKALPFFHVASMPWTTSSATKSSSGLPANMQKGSRSLLTPRVVCGPPCRSWQIVVPARGHWPPGRSTTAGYLAVRTSRYYPSYKQVKRLACQIWCPHSTFKAPRNENGSMSAFMCSEQLRSANSPRRS